MSTPFNRDALNTIRRNAGRVPPTQMAAALGWPLSQLERVARDHGLDIVIRPAPSEPYRAPLSAAQVESAAGPRVRGIARSISASTTLFVSDSELIDTIGRRHGLTRSRVLSRIIENARARGILSELAHLPAPLPDAASEPPRYE